jgi:anti-anti-sigma factor
MLTSLSPLQSPAGGLTVDVDLTAGRIALTGELDRSTCGHLACASAALAAAGPTTWVVDLAGVTFCDAPGLRALAAVRCSAERAGATAVVVGARPFLLRLLGLVGLDELQPAAPAPRAARRRRGVLDAAGRP